MLCYLGGCIGFYKRNNHFDKAWQWRRYATNKLNDIKIQAFDPTINYKENSLYQDKGVIYQNLHYLRKSDLMLLNLANLENSPGTYYEMFTFFNDHKPIVAFGDSPVANHVHVKEALTIRFPTLEEALKYIKSEYFLVLP